MGWPNDPRLAMVLTDEGIVTTCEVLSLSGVTAKPTQSRRLTMAFTSSASSPTSAGRPDDDRNEESHMSNHRPALPSRWSAAYLTRSSNVVRRCRSQALARNARGETPAPERNQVGASGTATRWPSAGSATTGRETTLGPGC